MNENHILIIDDDTRLRQLLDQYLTRNGFIVSEAANPLEAEHFLNLVRVDAMVMDIMMPQKNGDVFTKELRQKGVTTPILMLTAMGDTNSRITGLEAGADDYLPKPFEPKELLLRLTNLLKHNVVQNQPQIALGPYQYFPKTGHLSLNNTPISLTSTEQTLLDLLMKHLNTVVSRDSLAQWLNVDNERSVDVQITRLRKKLDPDSKLNFIQTMRGKGYRVIAA